VLKLFPISLIKNTQSGCCFVVDENTSTACFRRHSHEIRTIVVNEAIRRVDVQPHYWVITDLSVLASEDFRRRLHSVDLACFYWILSADVVREFPQGFIPAGRKPRACIIPEGKFTDEKNFCIWLAEHVGFQATFILDDSALESDNLETQGVHVIPPPQITPAIDAWSIELIGNPAAGFDLVRAGNVKAVTKRLSSIRNSRSGDCCIVATGPSIEHLDFRKISDITFFGVSSSWRKFDQYAGISPEYYIIATSILTRSPISDLEGPLLSAAKCFYTTEALKRIAHHSPRLISDNDVYLIDSIQALQKLGFDINIADDADLEPMRPGDIVYGFSKNIEKGFFRSASVTVGALMVAYYLGFRRIFILGYDLCDGAAGNPHFFKEKLPCGACRALVPHIHNLAQASRMCKRGEMEVYNVSPGSALPDDLLPKISFDEMCGMVNGREVIKSEKIKSRR